MWNTISGDQDVAFGLRERAAKMWQRWMMIERDADMEIESPGTIQSQAPFSGCSFFFFKPAGIR